MLLLCLLYRSLPIEARYRRSSLASSARGLPPTSLQYIECASPLPRLAIDCEVAHRESCPEPLARSSSSMSESSEPRRSTRNRPASGVPDASSTVAPGPKQAASKKRAKETSKDDKPEAQTETEPKCERFSLPGVGRRKLMSRQCKEDKDRHDQAHGWR